MVTTATTGDTTTHTHTVVGVFDGPNHAEQALNGLKAAGFTPQQVSVVAKDKQDVAQMAEHTDMAGESAATGAATGGVLGGLAGFLVGISALVIPGIGPIVGAGILVSTLAGAGIGAVAGGLVGALVGQGVSEEDAKGYEESVRQGSILLTVQAHGEAQAKQARAVFDQAGGGSVRGYQVPAR
jgi:uncharacterized membrane protein